MEQFAIIQVPNSSSLPTSEKPLQRLIKMPTLAELEQELKILGQPGPSYSLGRGSKLKVKHDKDDPFDIFMFIPFGRWGHEADKAESKRSVIADSFKEVLAAGLSGDIADNVCLIDLALLNEPQHGFMNEDAAGAGSMINHLADALNLPNVRKAKVVVRLLVGSDDQNQRRANFLTAQDQDDRLAKYKALFWDNKGQKLITHPDATLLVGYYNPSLVLDPGRPEKGSVLDKWEQFFHLLEGLPATESTPTPAASIPTTSAPAASTFAASASETPSSAESTHAKTIWDSIWDSISDCLHSARDALGKVVVISREYGTIFLEYVAKFRVYAAKFPELEEYARKKGLPAMSWNHSKFAAVNGRSMMTGGFNYWDDYMRTKDLILYDVGIKLQGDAAVAIHNFADEMWTYLARIDQKKDSRSMAWSTKLGADNPWFVAATSEDIQISLGKFRPDKTPKAQEGIQVLSTARIESMTLDDYQYPAQLLDAFRDIWFNAHWHASVAEQGNNIADHVEMLNDIVLRDIFTYLVGTSTSAWASKHARLWAITNAHTSIHISTETLVETIPDGRWDGPDGLVSEVNKAFELPKDKMWDGALWPYDLLVAMAKALSRFAALPAPDKDDHQPADNAIYLVVSSYDTNPRGYGDHVKISELKRRLTSIMRYMAWKDENSSTKMLPGETKVSDVDYIVDRHFLVKRIGATSSHQMHAKTICVDRNLLYVGSDNPYPHYNEEFGCWIEDPPSVKSFFAEFYDGIWERSVYDPN